MRERVMAEAKEGRELLGELLRTLAALLASGPVHREEFLQVKALILQKQLLNAGQEYVKEMFLCLLWRFYWKYTCFLRRGR